MSRFVVAFFNSSSKFFASRLLGEIVRILISASSANILFFAFILDLANFINRFWLLGEKRNACSYAKSASLYLFSS